MLYPPKLQDFLDTLSMFESRQDRIEALIGVAERFSPVPESVACPPYPEERRVPGCESEAFVWSRPLPDGTLKFHFAVQNPQGVSAKALATILDETLSGEPLDQVASVNEEVVYDIFGRELSMGKSMGLMGLVRAVRQEAQRRREG